MEFKKQIFWAIIIGVILAFTYMIYVTITGKCLQIIGCENEVFPEERFDFYWSCMDGCFNMLEVIYGEPPLPDELQELHTACTDMCWNQSK